MPTRADPFFISDLEAIAAFTGEQASESGLLANQLFVLIRDQAFLKTLFFAGDRAGDLGKVKTQELLYFQKRRPTLLSYADEKPL